MRIRKVCLPLLLVTALVPAQESSTGAGSQAPYRRPDIPIEERVRDLIGRMSLQEKARQLDMYAGVPDLIDKAIDKTHAAPDSKLNGDAAQKLFGALGVGSIHDLYPRAELANEIQRWTIEHSRLGIPALFIEEGLHGYDDGTVFPAPINLGATWNPDLAMHTGAVIASEMRAAGVHMVLAPVLDVAREPRWGRVEEDFGEDPFQIPRFSVECFAMSGDFVDSCYQTSELYGACGKITTSRQARKKPSSRRSTLESTCSFTTSVMKSSRMPSCPAQMITPSRWML
jgi:beta-glucosidase